MMLKAKRNRWIVLIATVVVLAVVNGAIWQKERHLAEGEIVYLELAPVDPRSLIQGDYMALNFALANQIHSALLQQEAVLQDELQKASNGYVVVRLDEQRIGHFQRLDEGTSLADDERQLRYRVRNGQVRFATDAFFFQEGHGERYEAARYGQFRVNGQGEPLLVALYDDELNRLGAITK
ncbi:GDYXXLXY domain-containing protein [Halomonas sp. SpR1]|uniref:GDYXXLXY domain-containing protein n=1 Tax=Halomonas sp. SpR1 TaxID=3050462 RepID=UPI0027E58E62|nr:GDYXXLXY domain-containing protein [Halomonas sp. SpR1]MDQ7734159.1 GDYXXLXY domain-containing protein [Halomonas sp. SpR1]